MSIKSLNTKFFRFLNFCLIFFLLFGDSFILAEYVFIFLKVFNVKKVWSSTVTETCGVYCPPVPEGYSPDLLEFDEASGWCFYPPTNLSSSGYPCPHPYLYDATYKKCKAYPQCSGGCVWNPDIRQCEGIPQAPGEILPGEEYSNMICVKGEITNDDVDNPEGIEIQNCIPLNPQCPFGSQFDSSDNLCYTLPIPYCPANSQLDSNTNLCYTSASFFCPPDLTYDRNNNVCYTSPVGHCPLDADYDSSTNTCYTAVVLSCPPESEYDSSNNVCYISGSITCPPGFTYNPSSNRCEAPVSTSCPEEFTYNSSTNRCEASPTGYSCWSGLTYNSSLNRCESSPSASCPLGFTYNSSTNRCETLPSFSCLEGFTYNTLTNRCESPLPDTTQYLCPIDLAQCQVQTEYYCPPNSQLDNNICFTSATPVCPPGSFYDNSTGTCYVYVTPSCPSGFTYNSSTNKCEANPSCPPGGSYNSATDRCEVEASTECPPGFTYNPATGKCEAPCTVSKVCSLTATTDRNAANVIQIYSGTVGDDWIGLVGIYTCGCPDCPPPNTCSCTFSSSGTGRKVSQIYSGSFGSNPVAMVGVSSCSCEPGTTTCEVSIESCPSGYTLQNNVCVAEVSCPSGSSFNPATDKCEILASTSCPSEFTYNSSRNRCETSPTYSCPSDFTYNSSTGRCETPPTVVQNDVCPYGSDKTCVEYNGQKVCSPYSCGMVEDTDEPDEPPSGLEDDTDFEEGSCLGTIYIFNGKKMRCRKAGIQTGFHNCCNESQGKLYDSTGSSGMMLGDAIKAIYFAMEIIKQARLVSSVEVIRVYGGNVELLGGPGQVLGSYPVNSPMGEVWQNVGASLTGGGVDYGGFIDYNVGAVSDDVKLSVYADKYLNKFAPQLAAQIVTLALSRAIGDPVLSAAVDLVAQAILAAMHLASPVGVALAAVNLGLALFMARCDTQDILTSTLNESKYCHYVGTRCVKKFLGICLQKVKVFCCFNSKLARIIHEQGRPQLSTFGPSGGWGSAKRPNCRGFTPEEFQAIDFARIDFSEYVEDIQRNIRQNIEPQMMEIFQKSISLSPGN